MRYSFDAPQDGPTQKHRQYYAMLGTRGIWEDGWHAAAVHAAISGKDKFDQDKWELYNVAENRSESKDLAKENPEKLQSLIKAWFEEAKNNFVLPLDDRSAREILNEPRPSAEPPHERYIYYPDTSPVPEAVAVNVRGRSYKILANVELKENPNGVIFAHGSRFGGHTLFIKNGKLYYVYNFLGIKPEQTFVSKTPLKPGKYTLGTEFIRESTGRYGESIGKTKLYVNDQVVAEGPMRTQAGKFTLSGDGLCIGYDSGDAVSQQYKAPGTLSTGELTAKTRSPSPWGWGWAGPLSWGACPSSPPWSSNGCPFIRAISASASISASSLSRCCQTWSRSRSLNNWEKLAGPGRANKSYH